MSLGVSGAAIPAIVGADSLRSWLEWFCPAGWEQPAQDTAWTGRGFMRGLGISFATNATGTVLWQPRGSTGGTFRVVDDIKVVDIFAIVGAVGAQACWNRFRPTGTVTGDNGSADFVNSWGPLLEAAAGVGSPLAMFIELWMRKRLAGDATSSAQFVGFVNDNGSAAFSQRHARIGLMGDGVTGFRFGSLNCPDAPAGGADNAAGAIDPDGFQPAALAAPGANWFHVRIKCVPGIEGQPGRFGCYLSGRLVKTYTDPARFPRTSRSGVDVSGAAYTFITPSICAWGNGGAAPSPGYYVRNIRVGYTEDLTL